MTEVIAIGDEIASMCEKFGLDKGDVRRIWVMPTVVVIDVYKRNEHGRFYVDETGEAAIDVVMHKVTT